MMGTLNRNMKGKLTVFFVFIVGIGSSLGLIGCKEDMKDLYQKAMKAYQAEEYQKTAELFETILKKYPDQSLSRKARYEMGKIYLYKLKQPQKALKHFQDLYAQSQPGKYSLEALKLIGHIYDTSLNDCLKGIEAYRLLIKDYASDIDAAEYQFAIAECYFKLHDYEQAMMEYKRLVEQYPNSSYVPRTTFQIANSYALEEEWEQSISLHEELLLSDTLSEQLVADNKLELAFCYEQQERFEDALKLYQELQGIDPKTVVIDMTLLERKIERVQKSIKESKKGPSEVDWKRK